MNYCWCASLAVQAVILARLARWRVALWWFAAFMLYDGARAYSLIRVRSFGTEAYRLAWGLSEPVGAVLLLAASIEAIRRPRAWWIGAAALSYAALAGLPRFEGVDGLIFLRGVALMAASAALAVSAIWHCHRHAVILAAYCSIDAIQALGIINGTHADSRPAQFLIFGQLACLILWALFVPEIRKDLQR